jgi:hypothetical protein
MTFSRATTGTTRSALASSSPTLPKFYPELEPTYQATLGYEAYTNEKPERKIRGAPSMKTCRHCGEQKRQV